MCSEVNICQIPSDSLRWPLAHMPYTQNFENMDRNACLHELFYVCLIELLTKCNCISKKQSKIYHNSGTKKKKKKINYDFGVKMIPYSDIKHH